MLVKLSGICVYISKVICVAGTAWAMSHQRVKAEKKVTIRTVDGLPRVGA